MKLRGLRPRSRRRGRCLGNHPARGGLERGRIGQISDDARLEAACGGAEAPADGEILLVHARQILRAYAEAHEALLAQRSARHLRIGITDTYVHTVLAPWLAGLIGDFPDTNLRVETGGSPMLLRRLEEALLDIAFLTEFQLEGDDRGELVHIERGVWACAEDCPALDEAVLPIALTFEGSVYRRLAQQMLRDRARAYRVALSANAESVIQAAVLSGAVVALLPISRMAPGMRELRPEEGFPEVPRLQVRMRVGRRRLAPAGDWLVQRLSGRLAAARAGARLSPDRARRRESASR